MYITHCKRDVEHSETNNRLFDNTSALLSFNLYFYHVFA